MLNNEQITTILNALEKCKESIINSFDRLNDAIKEENIITLEDYQENVNSILSQVQHND